MDATSTPNRSQQQWKGPTIVREVECERCNGTGSYKLYPHIGAFLPYDPLAAHKTMLKVRGVEFNAQEYLDVKPSQALELKSQLASSQVTDKLKMKQGDAPGEREGA